MLSLQSDPLAEDLKQQVEAVSRDVVEDSKEDSEGDAKMETTPPVTPTEECQEEKEPPGQVEYYVDYCVDRYAITYKTQVLYPIVLSLTRNLQMCIFYIVLPGRRKGLGEEEENSNTITHHGPSSCHTKDCGSCFSDNV